MSTFEKRLTAAAGADAVRRQEPMHLHTSFRIGGPADWFVEAVSPEQVREVTALCRQEGVPLTVIGNGTNLLVSDRGIRGAVLRIGAGLAQVSVKGREITAGAGVLLSRLARAAQEAGLSGLAFAGGIPGSLGGGVCMNAGAYGGELVQVLTGVTWLLPDGTLETVPAGRLELGYRTSVCQKNGAVVLEAQMALSPGDPSEIAAQMDDLSRRRREKQPLEYPSAGSAFKRPAGHFAGQLIEEAGLKGFAVGGAAVSEKHAGFVINTGGATARDVRDLLEAVADRVEKRSGIRLEPEIRMIGEW